MVSLKEVQTENLVERWNMIIDDYLDFLSNLKEDIIKINKMRNELLIIREELISRNIDVEDVEENPGRLNPP